MNLAEFLTKIIDDDIAAAEADYVKPRDKEKLAGSIAGFELCQGKTPQQLAVLLSEARKEVDEAFRQQEEDYWYWNCRWLEIEWVCNCVSAVLMNQKLPVIIPPTCRGVMKAAEIAGVKPSPS